MAWTSPISWTAGATVTAAQMNTEVRDHLNELKGMLDNITRNTAASSGNSTKLSITRDNLTDDAMETRITGETDERFRIRADGSLCWGGGGAPTVQGLYWDAGAVKTAWVLYNAQVGKMWPKAGPIDDSDIPSGYTGPNTGLFGYDSTNHKIMVKDGATWRSTAALT